MIKKYLIARYTDQWIYTGGVNAKTFHTWELLSGEYDTIEEAEAQITEMFIRNRGEQYTIMPLYYNRLGYLPQPKV